MSSPAQPAHLSNHQRNTLSQVFQHPAGHNIEWRAVLSLLEAVGSAEEQHGGKVAATIGSQTEYFDPPAHKDIDTQAVVNLRRMLTKGRLRSRRCGCRSQRPRVLTLSKDAHSQPGRRSHSAVRLCITDVSLSAAHMHLR